MLFVCFHLLVDFLQKLHFPSTLKTTQQYLTKISSAINGKEPSRKRGRIMVYLKPQSEKSEAPTPLCKALPSSG
ncbi:hypothetical protein XENTR_v10014295 [Xenopus tropicalis]|nr:hypothetical protein XENTR_v10014295 [Xenopus tropicalis]